MLPSRVLLVVALAAFPARARAQDDGTPEIPPPPPPTANAAEGPPPGPSDTGAASDVVETRPPTPPASGGPQARAATRAQARAETEAPRRAEGARASPSPSGESGILRVASAEGSTPGLIRVGLGFEFFTLGSFLEEGDENTRLSGVLALSGSPIDYLELWLNVRATSNTNDRTTPNLLQSQGDLQLGVKGFYPVADLASVGADLQLTVLSGIGEAGYDLGASEVRLRGLLTTDFRKAPERLPVRAHLNAGVIFDNSADLVAEGAELSEAERFALGVSDFDRVVIGAGIEVPVPYVTPYLEYTVEFPIDYLATPGVVITGRGLRTAQDAGTPAAENQVARPAYARIVPQRLTPGVRIRPTDDLAIDVAVEIGLTPDQAVGVPAVPDYNVVSLLTYVLDPLGVRGGGGGPAGPPVTIPVIVPEAGGEGARITGVVLDKSTKEPLGDAIVSFGDEPPVASAADGRFESRALTSGAVLMTVRKPGYEMGRAELSVAEGETSEVEVELEPEVEIGTLEGTVVGPSGAPVPDARLRLIPADGGPTRTSTTDAEGRFRVEVDASAWRVTVAADGFLRTGRAIEVVGGETSPEIALQLTPRGEVGARVDGDRIALPQPLTYAKGEIAPNAAARRGLDLVADLLLADTTLKVEIGGHTDSRGNERDNREVATRRAEAARTYLVEHGVPPEQVTAKGYGASRPIAPNLTRTGRERNRRIDLTVR